MSTYLSAYEDHLNRLIAEGGSESDVEQAVRDYNRPSPARLVEWVKTASLQCAYCDAPALTDGVKPTDEVTCAGHKP